MDPSLLPGGLSAPPGTRIIPKKDILDILDILGPTYILLVLTSAVYSTIPWVVSACQGPRFSALACVLGDLHFIHLVAPVYMEDRSASHNIPTTGCVITGNR